MISQDKILLLQEDTPSKSQIKRNIAYDENEIEWPGLTPMFAHP